MKVLDISEAKYSGLKDEGWLYDAITIANGNLKRVHKTYSGHAARSETKYWQTYKTWLKDNQPKLQSLYEKMKSDRNTFVDHAKDLFQNKEHAATVWTDALKMRQAEHWSGNIDQHDYKEYWDLIDNDVPAYQDYSIMASNTMIDRLGGFRDER